MLDISVAGSEPVIGSTAPNLVSSSAMSLSIIPLCPGIVNNCTVCSLARLFRLLCYSRLRFDSTVKLKRLPCLIARYNTLHEGGVTSNSIRYVVSYWFSVLFLPKMQSFAAMRPTPKTLTKLINERCLVN